MMHFFFIIFFLLFNYYLIRKLKQIFYYNKKIFEENNMDFPSKNAKRKFFKKVKDAFGQLFEVKFKIKDLDSIIYSLSREGRGYDGSYIIKDDGCDFVSGKPEDWEQRPYVIELKQKEEELEGLQRQACEIKSKICKRFNINIGSSYIERTNLFLKFWKMFHIEKKVHEIVKEAQKDSSKESQSNKDATVIMEMISFFLLSGLNESAYSDFLDFIKKCYDEKCLLLVALMVSRIDLYDGLCWGEGGQYKTDISSVINYKVHLTNIIFSLYWEHPYDETYEVGDKGGYVLSRSRKERVLWHRLKYNQYNWIKFILDCYKFVKPVFVECGLIR